MSYIGGIWIAMGGSQLSSEILRRLTLMPYLVNPHFAVLIKERRSRALTIMAHYFAIVSKFRNIWWIGAAGEREVYALAAVLTTEWKALLDWPLNIINS